MSSAIMLGAVRGIHRHNAVVLPRAAVAASARWRSTSTSAEKPLFKKVLIANRGEISCRVINTCKKMGIPTVAIYSEPDADAKHVLMADEAVCVGPAPSNQSYLVIDNILDAIKKTGADAVHPGYGFLSENQYFAKRLEEEGIEFIGPGENAIHYMGDKIESMRIAQQAGVSTAQRFDGEVNTLEHAQEIADGLGYPVIMKASAGGGGKGMRVAWSEAELKEGFQLAREEAASSFGDDRMLIQQFVCPYESRHIEIQVIGDKHGNYAAFPERECSIQRRNQKVIEESPSVLLSPETRLAMQQQAVMLAKSVGYHSAGTVEFIADNEQNFYFLEMNTRLQVEHPVTEEVTGVDLVECMIRVAAGEELPEHLKNKEVPFDGWAIESRVYAEDPLRSFLPSTGNLIRYEEPDTDIVANAAMVSDPSLKSDDVNVRIDSGVYEGSAISMFYDPMICKLITKAPTRDGAIGLMAAALDSYVVRGVKHNIPLCRVFMEHPKFIAGDLSTDFIKDEYPEGFVAPVLSDARKRMLFTAALEMLARSGFSKGSPVDEMISATECGDFYVGIGAPGTQVVNMERRPVTYEGNGKYTFTDSNNDSVVVSNVEDVEWTWPATPLFIGTVKEEGEGTNSSQRFVCQLVERLDNGIRVELGGIEYDIAVLNNNEETFIQHMIPLPVTDTSKTVLSPMPGALISVAVEVGQEVEPGQELCVLEAMKMQNVLHAEAKGTIKSIKAAPGDNLEVDQLIIEFE